MCAKFPQDEYTVLERDSVPVYVNLVNLDSAGVTVVSWSFYPDTAPYSTPKSTNCTSGSRTCAFKPTEDGYLVADIGLFEGGVRARAHIQVIKCPIQDPRDAFLNDPGVRSTLRAALDVSGAFTQPDTARRENGGFIVRSKSTGALRTIAAFITSATPCTWAGSASWDTASFALVAMYHVHPFDPGGRVGGADILPSNCGALAGQRYVSAPSSQPAGDPGTDWAQAVLKQVPYYYIDKKRVGVADGRDPAAADQSKWRSLARRYDWNTSSCRW